MATEIEEENSSSDIAKTVEKTLLGVFYLFGQIVITAKDFFIYPRIFAARIIGSKPLEKEFPNNYSRPLTYFFISQIILIGGCVLWFKTDAIISYVPLENPLSEIIFDSIKKGSIYGLIIGSSPLILALGLFSFCLFSINRKKIVTISFEDILNISSYFIGTVCLIYILFLPLMLLFEDNFSNLNIVFSILGWSTLLRTSYCYLALLKNLIKEDRKITIHVFGRGLILFLFLYSLIILWIYPLLNIKK